MTQEISLKIILENPPAGVDFGLQKGSGSNYETIQKQRSGTKDLHFEFTITVKWNKDGSPNFLGAFVQGTPNERFIYIDIGTCAGQADTAWSRRLKIPLKGFTTAMIKDLLSGSAIVLETRVPGTGKDGGPNCATVKPFGGWNLSKKNIGKK
jgi:Family of unknown function (DUF5990)